MTGAKVTFHIQRAAKPGHLEHLISIFPEDALVGVGGIVMQLQDEGYAIDHNGAVRTLDLASKIGLIDKVELSHYKLTNRGKSCRNLALFRKDVYYDIIHFLMYATWEIKGKEDYWSWSYMKICEAFWRSRPKKRPSREIFGQIMADAAEYFPDLKPAAGTETVDKVVEFLRNLNPPFFVVNDEKITTSKERDWFSIELAILSIYYLYIVRGLEISSPLLIDRAVLELLSPLCLASPYSIMLLIETASKTYPYLDIHKGEWGSSVILQQKIDIPTIS